MKNPLISDQYEIVLCELGPKLGEDYSLISLPA